MLAFIKNAKFERALERTETSRRLALDLLVGLGALANRVIPLHVKEILRLL